MVTGVTSGDSVPSTYLVLVYYQNILCRKCSILNSVSARNYLGHFLREYITNWKFRYMSFLHARRKSVVLWYGACFLGSLVIQSLWICCLRVMGISVEVTSTIFDARHQW